MEGISSLGYVRRSLAVALAGAGLAVAATGCTKKEENKAAPEPSASAAESPVDKVEAFLKDDSASLTPEVYEKLVLRLEKCKLKDTGIDYKCAEYKQLKKARNRNTALKNLVGMNASVGKKLIDHKSPAVRYYAAGLMKSMLGAGKDSQKIIIDAAAKEKDPIVLKQMINVVGSRHKSNEAIKKLLLDNVNHEHEKVRTEVLSWFLTSFGQGVEGTFEKALEAVDNDKSLKVRKFVCSRLYGSGDKRALPVFEKYLMGKDTPKELHNGCFTGVIKAWTGFPKPKEPSKEAYELTLKYLNQKPRTKEMPPWTGMSTLRAANDEFKDNDKFGKEWFEKVKPWFKKAKLLSALENIVTDSDANWMARTGALRTMGQLNVDKKVVEKIAKKYADSKPGKDGDWHVKNAAEKLLKKMK